MEMDKDGKDKNPEWHFMLSAASWMAYFIFPHDTLLFALIPDENLKGCYILVFICQHVTPPSQNSKPVMKQTAFLGRYLTGGSKVRAQVDTLAFLLITEH